MASLIEIEKAASQLRRHLRIAQLSELKILCGLRFFTSFDSDSTIGFESYVREFIPVLAKAAGKCNPAEFLPEELESLDSFIKLLLESSPDFVNIDNLGQLKQLRDNIRGNRYRFPDQGKSFKGRVPIASLFVEYYPDLDLPPRGRLLNLYVTANRISSKAEDDDIVVRNPVEEPDDRFLAQARESVKAARKQLFEKFGLSFKKKYRFDFALDSTGALFTGDSLGVAFAIGAIAAISRIEVFRERLSVNEKVAFSGALSSNGVLGIIDPEALRLKIYRAFYSDMEFLIIPRQHINDAKNYLIELQKHSDKHKLELVGADRLDEIASDSRLVSVKPVSFPAYAARKAVQAGRSVWVEIPALILLMAILFYTIAPIQWMPWFDDNPAYMVENASNNSLDVYNRDSLLLWADTISCNLSESVSLIPASISFGHAFDMDSDGKNEVVYLPRINED